VSCELCNLEKKTKWYYEDDRFIICDCLTCGTPMVVWKEHTLDCTAEERGKITEVCKRLFGERFLAFRVTMRKIPNHLHWHIILSPDVEKEA